MNMQLSAQIWNGHIGTRSAYIYWAVNGGTMVTMYDDGYVVQEYETDDLAEALLRCERWLTHGEAGDDTTES